MKTRGKRIKDSLTTQVISQKYYSKLDTADVTHLPISLQHCLLTCNDTIILQVMTLVNHYLKGYKKYTTIT
jgi:hypothetical protein